MIGVYLRTKLRGIQRSIAQIPKAIDKQLLRPDKLEFEYSDLYFPHEEEYTGGFQTILKRIRKDPSVPMNQRSSGYILYNMGIADIKDEVVIDLIFSQIKPQKGKFREVYALGGLYGVLALNLDHKWYDFFVNELATTATIWTNHFTDLVEGLAKNTSIPLETRHALMQEVVEPELMGRCWKKSMKYSNLYKFRLITALYNLEYFHTETYTKIVESLLFKKPAYKTLLALYEQLCSLQDRDVDVPSLDLLIEKCLTDMKRRKDIEWFYNIEERRFRTYEEMYQRKELNPYPDQTYNPIFLPEELELARQELERLKHGEDKADSGEGLEYSDKDILKFSAQGKITKENSEEDEDDDLYFKYDEED